MLLIGIRFSLLFTFVQEINEDIVDYSVQGTCY